MNEPPFALDSINFAPIDESLELLLSQQIHDWKRGERHPVKVYLDRRPELLDQVEARIELINQEIVLRRRGGESPKLGEYLLAFPDLSEPLTQLFDIHAAIALPLHSLLAPPGGAELFHQRSPIDIPGYTIERRLGSGGMGVVYLANEVALERKVAIKVLRDRFDDDPRARDRFQREAAAVAKCQHPNLVQIFQVGEHENDPYLVLEYVEGDTLAKFLDGKPKPAGAAAAMVEKLARAIAHAHGRGVVHRDLKPANVLLDRDGEPKVSDFGLARLDDRSTRTEEGCLPGTPAYMAPEQVSSTHGVVGPATDIHALGVILYEALTGRIPYRADTLEETLNRILCDQAEPPSKHEPGVPRDLEAICLKCLEKKQAHRYKAAVELAEDLRRFLDGRPTLARPLGVAGRLWRWGRRNPKEAILSAAVLGSLLLGSIASTVLAVRAIQAEASTGHERDRAEIAAANASAINDFLRKDLLAQASSDNQAEFGVAPDPDLKVRTALDRAAARIGERFIGQPLLEAAIRQTIGDAYLQIGLYTQALPHLERAWTLRRHELGDAHPDSLAVMESIGTLYLADGKLAEAEPYLVGASDGLRSARGADHPETLTAMKGLAHLYVNQDRLSEAEDLITQVRNVLLTTRGVEDLETLDATNSLAVVRQAQKKLELAKGMLIEVLGLASGKLGKNHPTTLTMKSNLAGVYVELGDQAEAVRLYEEAVEARSSVLGKRHPDTLESMVKLGCLYADQGRLDKAEPLLNEALAGCRAALDRNHDATDAALAGLASVYSQKRDMRRLGETLIESAEISRFRWGFDNNLSAAANQTAGTLLLIQGEFARAEGYLRDALKYWTKNDPAKPERSFGELRLGVCLLARRQFVEAQARLMAAYNGLGPRGQEDQPMTKAELRWLADQMAQLRDAQGRIVQEASLGVLRNNPQIRGIVLDLQFPSQPFAPP